eukprot:SAG31_NODE_199_length_20573_cov_5.832129_12_plen_65_part_00
MLQLLSRRLSRGPRGLDDADDDEGTYVLTLTEDAGVVQRRTRRQLNFLGANTNCFNNLTFIISL